jgi:DNA polymerase-3 subunit alpha
MTAPFVHLRLHTEYSLVDGLIRIKSLVRQVAAAGMPAVAVTDMSNLFALIKFYKAALGAGIKPIVGVEAWVRRQDEPTRLVLLCQNLTGYRHLTRLVSRGYLEGQQRGVPVIDHHWLRGNTEGLIALSGGREGELGQALLNDHSDQARTWLADWRELFPDRFYLEVQRTGRLQEEEYLEAVLDLAAATGTPVVATNEVCFLQREDFEAHEARVCVHDGAMLDDPRRPHRHSDQQYLRTPAEMAELFADLPEALENSVEIARRCNLRLELGKNVLPDFPVPEGMTADAYFSAQARAGLEWRLPRLFDPAAPDFAERRRPYDERLEAELKVIIQMGFPGYFLIVADFIRWAREHEVPVGPGRGSGAGSLVAYALGITDLDPLAYDLLFERFLNPERVSMPDFDIDFCMEGRDKVIEYVAQRYGRDRVSQIATHGSMAAKAVVRDVGRVLGHPYGLVDRIAKLIPFELGITLDKAIEQEAELRRLYEHDEEIRALIDLARKLEGLARNVGKHAGGVVIAPTSLTDFSPLYREEGDSSLVTQFDKDDVEAAGLVKFDFLGLRTLTIIDWAVRTINDRRKVAGEPPLEISAIPLDDAPTFDLLKRHRTTAVFQLESSGMKDLIRRLQPDCFEDIVALVALFRPGPLQSGMVDDFIDRKHGRARIEYPHPALTPILKPTYGVILYQEQVMQIAQVLSGYTLGGADLLRRAMGKKDAEKMAKERDGFVKGAVERQTDPATASYIFDLIDKFAGYGFNKCLSGNTVLMEANTGELTTIEALFKNPRQFAIHALDDSGKLQVRQVSAVMWNGRKPVFELTTALGKRITATANHPFRMLDGWISLENLRIGDRIAVPRRLQTTAKKTWPRHELITLAGLLSEGNTCHPTCLYFYGNEPLLVEDFAAAAAKFPNSVARVYRRSNNRLEVCVSTGQDRRFHAGQIPWNARPAICGSLALAVEPEVLPRRSGAFEWARELDLLGRKAAEKQIPSPMFELCDADLELFLGRLWAGDGFIATGKRVTLPPFYATSSRQLADGVQSLLLRLGIVSRIESKQFKYRGGLRPGYVVRLVGESMLETFVERIAPHVVGRESQLETLRRYLASVQPAMTSKDTIPAAVRAWVAAERTRLGLTWKELEQRSGVSMKEFLGQGSTAKQGFWRTTIKRLARFLGGQRLSNLANSDLFWDRVVSIEPKGIADTYDLTVKQNHNFVANGLVVHNSHSAAYALLSYQTAWLKAHYPAAFMAAVLSSDMDKTDKVVVFIEECRRMALKLVPPAINESNYRFTVGESGEIRYGLGAIKGAGEGAIEALARERRQGGPFRDLFDLCQRVDLRKLNRRVLDALVRSGAFDALGPNRATLMAQLPEALQLAEQHSRNDAAGQNDLFGLAAAERTPARPLHVVEVPEWDEEERLRGEKETLGVYLTGHPIRRLAAELDALHVTRLCDLAGNGGSPRRGSERPVSIAGLVVSVRVRNANRGGRMAFVTLDDDGGRIEIRLFPEVYERHRSLIVEDTFLLVQGTLGWDEFNQTTRLTVERVLDLDGARAEYARRLIVRLGERQCEAGVPRQLARILAEHCADGRCAVWVEYTGPGARVELAFGPNWRVRPGEALLKSLRELAGAESVQLCYEPQTVADRNSLA